MDEGTASLDFGVPTLADVGVDAIPSISGFIIEIICGSFDSISGLESRDESRSPDCLCSALAGGVFAKDVFTGGVPTGEALL